MADLFQGAALPDVTTTTQSQDTAPQFYTDYLQDIANLGQSAVQQGAKGHFVWVIDKDGKAENRPVTPGDWYGDQWFINSGLAAGEQVVVGGALKLRAGAQVKAAPYVAKAPDATPVVKPADEKSAKAAAPADEKSAKAAAVPATEKPAQAAKPAAAAK